MLNGVMDKMAPMEPALKDWPSRRNPKGQILFGQLGQVHLSGLAMAPFA
jgi:hypothetical protein